jgi:hypothetical protein
MSKEEEKSLSEQLNQISLLLYNDKHTGREGLVQKVDTLREDFDAYLTEKSKEEAVHKGKMAVYGAIGGAVTAIILFLAKLLLPFLFKFA